MFKIFTVKCFKLAAFFMFVFIFSQASSAKDYYEVLGVKRDATAEQIKQAYRQLSMRLHPDRFVGNSEDLIAVKEAEFKEMKAAYDVLSDQAKRTNYNRTGDLDAANSFENFSYRSLDQILEALSNSDRLSSRELNVVLRALTNGLADIINLNATII